MGTFGEESEDLQNLVQIMAESRVAAMGLARGRPGTDTELGVLVGQVRRRLSVVSVTAQAECLLARLSPVGEGVVQADKRRQWVARQEENMRRERAAQYMGRVLKRRLGCRDNLSWTK